MIFYEEIIRDFQKLKVKYVLVGGVAVNLLGGNRNTADMDILVEMSDDNLAKIVKILKKHGFGVKQPVDPMGIADRRTREDWIKNKNMKAFNFYKGDETYEEVDIIIASPVSYQKAARDVIIVKVGKYKLPVMSVDHLIRMKKIAGRPVDLFDVKQLKDLKKDSKK